MNRDGMQDLSNIVKVRRLTLTGHILRLSPDRPASVAMLWVPDGGKTRRGRPSKTWRQTFQKDLQEMRVSWSGVRRATSDRSLWKSLVSQYSSRSGRIYPSHSSCYSLNRTKMSTYLKLLHVRLQQLHPNSHLHIIVIINISDGRFGREEKIRFEPIPYTLHYTIFVYKNLPHYK